MYLHFAPVQKICSVQRQTDGIADEGPAFDVGGGIVVTCLRKFPARKPRCTGKGNATRVQPEGHDFAGPANHEGVKAQAKSKAAGAGKIAKETKHRNYSSDMCGTDVA